MSPEVLRAQKLIRWVEGVVIPFYLKQDQKPKAEALAEPLKTLKTKMQSAQVPMAACFLGFAGIGKSTLINALVTGDGMIVPHGGIGPLTAQALRVGYAPEPYFQVEYHPAAKLNQVVFGLERMFRHELGDGEGELVPVPDTADEGALLAADLPDDESDRERRDQWKNMAQLLVTGDQHTERKPDYLIDRLYEALGRPPKYKTDALDEDRARVDRLRDAMAFAKAGQTRLHQRDGDAKAFTASMKEHACGFLAPLIREMTVYWDAPLLQHGVELVDLPGVGASGDVHRRITERWIREDARVVVLVVGNRGFTEADVDILRSTGFLMRLLWGNDPKGTPRLILAVTKLDDIAESKFAEDPSINEAEHFAAACEASKALVRQQLSDQLASAWVRDAGDATAKQDVVASLMRDVEVFPVSAIQYRQVRMKSRRAFLDTEDQSNIPALADALAALRQRDLSHLEAGLRESSNTLAEQLLADLRLLQARWTDDQHAASEADRLRADLTVFITPLRGELRTRQGQYREFLKETVPQQIETMVGRAREQARRDNFSYLDKLRDAHWSTLRAAVRRGGTFFGARHIDLPRDFGERFEEPIAEVWGTEILKKIRSRTKEYTDDTVALVDRVVEWAREQGTRVRPKVIEAQRDAIKADARRLHAVGRDKIDDLHDRVKAQLIKKIEDPIRKRCLDFVQRGEDVGRGMSYRIHGLFRELADEVAMVASEPATQILTKLFREVADEIHAVFDRWQDPLEACVNALAETHADYRKRSDAQKREGMLDAIGFALNECPEEFSTGSEAHATPSEETPSVTAT